ncbi:hypothetical protein [Streptomyces hypolithicus]
MTRWAGQAPAEHRAVLRDPDIVVRAAAPAALSAGCPDPYGALAVTALADGSLQVRASAATARAALATAVPDPDADVRAYASRAGQSAHA